MLAELCDMDENLVGRTHAQTHWIPFDRNSTILEVYNSRLIWVCVISDLKNVSHIAILEIAVVMKFCMTI